MKKGLLIVAPIVIVLILAVVYVTTVQCSYAAGTTGESDSQIGIEAGKRRPHETIMPHVPRKADFCGEKMPLERFDVRESLEREVVANTFWHTNTLLCLKRSGRYFPIIEPILRENGMPEDIKYLCVAESNLIPTAKSPAGAVGLWQFMEGTAKEYGLKVTQEIDERMDVEKSTRAACKMLKADYEKLGSWALVAAAYNAGKNRVKKVVDAQHENNYYDLYWGEETGRYVYRIVALKTVMSNPDDYGFDVSDGELYEPYKTRKETVNSTIEDLAQWAKDNGTTYKMLKILNPGLKKMRVGVPAGSEVTILLPEE
ncbi:MAG: lytic transglycosylase domain-containing protein [Bacteroidales bacterium]|nr:lytic transglycosylase domain-containing protein [Bacteroidales bacterium]